MGYYPRDYERVFGRRATEAKFGKAPKGKTSNDGLLFIAIILGPGLIVGGLWWLGVIKGCWGLILTVAAFTLPWKVLSAFE